MEFRYRYRGHSEIQNTVDSSEIRFEPDTLREPAYFVAELQHAIGFREAMSALHDVVISDLRIQPKDRQLYFEWLAQNEAVMLAEFVGQKAQGEKRIKEVRAELDQIQKASSKIMNPYYSAQQRYFDYILHADYDAWLVLDPVITVHPDEVFFECFSKDESTYARLSCGYENFGNITESSYGTTNIDYSDDLYNEFQKLREYKTSQFRIDPSGFEVNTTNEDSYTETKIDLPDSWVRGFLQVSSAMGMPMTELTLHPMDIHNICFMLRRQRETHGPRSIRFQLTPDKPITMLFEPWNKRLTCHRSIYKGNQEQEIRIWGRRRILTLERLIPISNHFTVHLLGTGMPSFFVAHMDNMAFTLGLSGWTANDWSRAGNFDLLAPRADVDDISKTRIFNGLKENWFESAETLAKRLQLDKEQVLAGLGIYTQAGRVIYDLVKGVYRVRELSREPLPVEKLRFENEREQKADNFVNANLAKVTDVKNQDDFIVIKGSVRDDGRLHEPTIVIDEDQRLVEADCSCHFYVHNKLYKGPCEHMLALRREHQRSANH